MEFLWLFSKAVSLFQWQYRRWWWSLAVNILQAERKNVGNVKKILCGLTRTDTFLSVCFGGTTTNIHVCVYRFVPYAVLQTIGQCVNVCFPTLRGFCVMSSILVDRRLSFMATYRRLPSSSGSRECRSPATRGSVSRRPFWISSEKDEGKKSGFNSV